VEVAGGAGTDPLFLLFRDDVKEEDETDEPNGRNTTDDQASGSTIPSASIVHVDLEKVVDLAAVIAYWM